MNKKTVSFENAISKNHNQLKAQLNALLTVISNLKLTDKQRLEQAEAHCAAISSVCNILNEILHPEDIPIWLKQISKSINIYKNKGFEPKAFQEIYNNIPEAIGHEWSFQSSQDAIDFDEIYRKYREDSELPKLLDELIALLKKLIEENGEELQNKTLQDLSKIVITLNKNKNASSSAIESTLILIFQFFKNSFFTLFPAVQISVDGVNTIRKIAEIITKAFSENKKIQENVLNETQENLSNKITYNSNGTIDTNSMIPQNILEHYIDNDV